MNAINVIFPYRYQGMWVFDDARVGLDKEPFVAGADTMIDRATAGIPDARDGFRLTFSEHAFPGHQLVLEWRRQEGDGDWYWSPQLGQEGWLCPALLRYFEAAPRRIYVATAARSGSP